MKPSVKQQHYQEKLVKNALGCDRSEYPTPWRKKSETVPGKVFLKKTKQWEKSCLKYIISLNFVVLAFVNLL